MIGACKTYIINLERRPDRLLSAMKQLDKTHIDYRIFPAIDGKTLGITGIEINNPGLIGCYLSHFFIFQEAVMNNYKRIAIFEDDIIIHDNFTEKMTNIMREIPSKWEILYMGYYERNPGYKTKINEDIVIQRDIWGTHAFMVQNDGIRKIWDKLKTIKAHIDVQLSQYINKDLYTYCVYPSLCSQSGVKSDIA